MMGSNSDVVDRLSVIGEKIARIERLCDEWEESSTPLMRRGNHQRVKDAYQDLRELVRSEYRPGRQGDLSPDDPDGSFYLPAIKEMWVATRFSEFSTAKVNLENLRELRDLLRDLAFHVVLWQKRARSGVAN
jgi:hypothetical protein